MRNVLLAATAALGMLSLAGTTDAMAAGGHGGGHAGAHMMSGHPAMSRMGNGRHAMGVTVWRAAAPGWGHGGSMPPRYGQHFPPHGMAPPRDHMDRGRFAHNEDQFRNEDRFRERSFDRRGFGGEVDFGGYGGGDYGYPAYGYADGCAPDAEGYYDEGYGGYVNPACDGQMYADQGYSGDSAAIEEGGGYGPGEVDGYSGGQVQSGGYYDAGPGRWRDWRQGERGGESFHDRAPGPWRDWRSDGRGDGWADRGGRRSGAGECSCSNQRWSSRQQEGWTSER